MANSSIPIELLRLKVEGTPLTRTEISVLRLQADGLREEQVAAARGVGYDTIRKVSRMARARLGARNTTHAVAIAIRRGLL